ncbi:hypothetical protein A8L48_22035 [Rhizobium rhizogenes]|nr:hypothetical protein A8L48_22035 [Rhizobium rhizogenes]
MDAGSPQIAVTSIKKFHNLSYAIFACGGYVIKTVIPSPPVHISRKDALNEVPAHLRLAGR